MLKVSVGISDAIERSVLHCGRPMWNSKKVKWLLLAVSGSLGLILMTLKPVPPPKVRAQRIHGLNHLANVTITLPSTNTLPGPTLTK
jgi:hypothetical protein